MDDREREHVRKRMNRYRGGSHPQWSNMVSQQQHMKEQNAFFMNMKMFFAERDAAIAERDRALAEKGAAIEERDMVIRQRDTAFAERDNALRERDNAIAALHFQQDNNASVGFSYRIRVTDAVPISSVASEAVRLRQRKQKPAKGGKKKSNPSKRAGGRDRVTTDGSKVERDARDRVGPTIRFDKSTMPAPVCTCTGVARQCYKWGSGGWQSSCCTTSLSAYPLPPLPPKRRGRIAGRKMRGSVFSRLLTRLSFVGHHDLSTPLDLKNYWAKHGTNRYITIK